MRKIMLVLVVLLLAAPSMAVVTLTATDELTNDGWVTISYVQSSAVAGDRPRAFGLDITASAGEICEVDTTGCQPFPVYMGTIVINASGTVVTPGTPVAPAGAPGSAGPLGSGAVTIEMGSLYVPPGPAGQPLLAGNLIRVKVNQSCTLSVTPNAARATGGVVLENGATPGFMPGPGLEATAVAVVYGGPDYVEWHSLPDIADHISWANANQCHGDIDGLDEAVGFARYRVGLNDIPLFTGAFLEGIFLPDGVTPNPKHNPAADLDHAGEQVGFGWYRCGLNDIPVFTTWFLVESSPTNNMPDDCQSCSPVSP